MENNKTSFHKFMDATQGVKVAFNAISDLKSVQDSFNSKSVKASNLLLNANKSLNEARKDAVDGLKKAQVAQKMAKELGVDEQQYNGWVSQFENELKKLESIMQIIGDAINKL